MSKQIQVKEEQLNKIADSITAEFRRYNANNGTSYLVNTNVLVTKNYSFLQISSTSFTIDQLIILQKYGFKQIVPYGDNIISSIEVKELSN